MSVSHTQVSLSLEQEHAVDLCCDTSQRIVSVTGGAGTGKTLVLGCVYKAFRQRNRLVALCAPTGRAAKRIQELTSIKAKTIHRLLEYPMPDDDIDPDTPPDEPKRNKQNPLDARMIIVDEASMLSPTLYRQLIDALHPEAVIRFFGDNNQLPPVEEGTPPFIDILKKRPSVELSYNFRSGDLILSNAQKILRGMMPVRNERFEIIYSYDPLRELLRFVTPQFAEAETQIIMPTRRGKYGTMRVNPSLQLRFNATGPLLRLDRFDEKEAPLAVRANDKFLWIKNDYSLNMFNGEIGSVAWIDPEDGELGLDTPERRVNVPSRVRVYSHYHGTVIAYDPRKQIELGYAITTHKAQGSEFDTIVYCITGGQAWLLNRRNFYTAVTRAKSQVIIITDRRAMGLSLRRASV